MHERMVGWRREALRLAVLATGAASSAGTAAAGAWPHRAGDGQQIATVSRENGDFGGGWRSDVLIEGGLGGGWTLSFKTQSLFRTELGYDERTTYEAGARRSFALSNRSVAAVQLTVLGGESLVGPVCEGGGYETRAAYGVSADVGGLPAFVNVEAAWRERGSNCGRAVIEGAAGVEFAPRWQAIGKAWTEQGKDARSDKAEAVLLRDFGDFNVGLGYRREMSGRFAEEAVLLTYWSSF